MEKISSLNSIPNGLLCHSEAARVLEAHSREDSTGKASATARHVSHAMAYILPIRGLCDAGSREVDPEGCNAVVQWFYERSELRG